MCSCGDHKDYTFNFVCLHQKIIVEQLFTACSDAMSTSQPTKLSAANFSCNFTEVEENAVYYTSGYVIKKLLHQYEYKTYSGEATEYLVKAILSLLGDSQDSMETK